MVPLSRAESTPQAQVLNFRRQRLALRQVFNLAITVSTRRDPTGRHHTPTNSPTRSNGPSSLAPTHSNRNTGSSNLAITPAHLCSSRTEVAAAAPG